MDTNSRIQELANNSEIENSPNKSHAKIYEFTVHVFQRFSKFSKLQYQYSNSQFEKKILSDKIAVIRIATPVIDRL